MRFAFAIVGCVLSLTHPLPGRQQQQQQPPAGQQPSPQGQQQRRAPRPYAEVIPPRAVTDSGGINVHRVDDRWFFEVSDSLRDRDSLLVSRIAGVPQNFGGFTSAGTSVEEQVVRWERHNSSVLLRSVSFNAVADDFLPIALSVASNNVGPILATFPIQAFGRDSASYVLDVTEFFAGDTPGISGLSPAQRRQYQVRRLDPARSYVSAIRAFPLNVEVRHTQTFDAGEPPSDQRTNTISLEMRQSLVLLPREPMRPRFADQRVGFFTVSRVNYGLDEYKAATQQFIRRWRLEPKDPAAYARGELVEPVKPIAYYIDPATPTKWRKYVKQGVEDWQKPFEATGFKNAILARDPPSPAEDPEWDPEDIRYSVVRWAASLVRNAVGPSTADPRTGEIIESDITWYHNHLRSYQYPDANRRALHRVYLERLEALVTPPQPATQAAGGGAQAPPGPPPSPLLGPINVQRSDLPALARRELRAIQAQARAAGTAAPAGVVRAHWQDVVDRVDAILEVQR